VLAGLDAAAGVTGPATGAGRVGTAQGLGQRERGASLAHALWPVEKAGVGQPPGRHGSLKHGDRVTLSDYFAQEHEAATLAKSTRPRGK
jgi:hypothetical protein